MPKVAKESEPNKIPLGKATEIFKREDGSTLETVSNASMADLFAKLGSVDRRVNVRVYTDASRLEVLRDPHYYSISDGKLPKPDILLTDGVVGEIRQMWYDSTDKSETFEFYDVEGATYLAWVTSDGDKKGDIYVQTTLSEDQIKAVRRSVEAENLDIHFEPFYVDKDNKQKDHGKVTGLRARGLGESTAKIAA